MKRDNKKNIDDAILKDILETGLIGYWDWNIPSGEDYMSPSLKMMFGYEEDEIENTREAVDGLIFEEDKHIAREKFNAHVMSRGKIPFECDIRNHHKNGSVVWVLSRGKVIEWDEKGNPVRMVGCNIDITGQKQGEEHQRNIAANLQAVMGATNDLIASYDSNFRLIICNEAYGEFFRRRFNTGISAEMRVIDLIPGPMRSLWESCASRVLSGESFTIEHDIPDPEGDVVSYEMSYNPIRTNGSVSGYTTFIHDITERKRTERALSESEAKYRSLVDNMSDAIYKTDLDGNILYTSPSAARILGYQSASDLVGVNLVSEFYAHPEDHKKIIFNLDKFSEVNDFEVDLRRRDGSIATVITNTHYTYDSGGSIIGIEGIYHDISDRKQSEDALKKSEAFLRSIFEASPAGIALAVDRKFTKVNNALCRITGYSEDELIGNSTRVVYFSDQDYDQAGAVYGEITHNAVGVTQARLRNKDGRMIYALICLSPLNHDDLNAGVVSTVLDISDITLAEQTIKRNEVLLARLFDSSPVGIALLVDRHFVKVNKSYCRITGYSENELLGSSPAMLYFFEEDFNNAGKVYETISEKKFGVVETRHRKKDGTEIIALIYLSPLSQEDETAGIIATVFDITDRKRAEQALKTNEARLQTIFDASPAGIALLNDRKFEKVNKAFYRITGYPENEVIGETTRLLYSDENEYARVGGFYNSVYKTGPVITETMFRTKSGKDINIFLSLSPLDPNDRDAGVIGAFLDITQLKDMEREKSKLEEMLLHSQKMESIGRLAGGIAHDFNNMLTAILGNAELIKEHLPPSGREYAEMEIIERAATSAVNLTRQLLAFSRKQVIEPKIMNLNDSIRNIKKMLLTLLGETIILEVICDAQLGNIKADSGYIEQVIINLAVNARDAMPDGGKLVIETANVILDEAYSLSHINIVPGRFAMLAISDTGVGMTKEIAGHCFEPFFTTKENGKGTGLGLATVYGIVNQCGGSIAVYSEPGKGTVFKIYFPFADGEASHAIAHETSAAALTGNETILIVEDNEYVLKLSEHILTRAGYVVITAATGEDAVKVVDDFKGEINLLITDVILPGMNGKEISGRISERHPDIRTLFSSGYTAEVIDRQGMLETGIDFIGKPYTSQQLTAKVREILDRS